MQLGSVGIWSGELRFADAGEIVEAAAELEALGYGALWIPGGAGGNIFDASERLLDATNALVVATGIVNIWMHTAAETAAEHARLTATHPGRFLLGLGISHALLVDATDQTYERPLQTMQDYLDQLDQAEQPVPHAEMVLAALGPKMLELAARRTAGAHPYLVTPEHTALARERLGPGSLLAPEQKVVLETDPDRARAVGRHGLALYLQLPNYTNNWLRFGFTEDDLHAGGSDRLVDALVAWGDMDAITARVGEHHAAGADHVCLQVLNEGQGVPRQAWRDLAAAFALG